MSSSKELRQHVRYVTASDGIRLAWADSGAGPCVVKAANWLTHLEYEWHSPVWQHWLHFFASHYRFIRYDERGCGMSDWQTGRLSVDQWADDLETVIEASAATGPLVLLGVSQGASTCIAYALRHPDRVAGLILYGGYARGSLCRDDVAAARKYEAITELIRLAWGSDNPAFRQVFTSRFIPDGTPDQLQWYNDLCLKTARGDVAAMLLEARGRLDITPLLEHVRVPTLVLHGRDDAVVPVAEGRLLASRIAGAEYVELDSRNHVLLEHEPAWTRFREAVLAFAPSSTPPADDAFDALSTREREVLALMSDGLGNRDIAERLGISEKTVRNHASNVFDKLGVWSRAQAIVFARERGFRP